jgi:2-polyprenyl-6-methoxyphenol hydroxylase-like FAD-dependent oxidoreductase
VLVVSLSEDSRLMLAQYTLDNRIFLGGDATHTHSPKAGQGCVLSPRPASKSGALTTLHSMNISMLDMYSLAWKINLVEKGIGNRDILLPSYEQERKHVAEELLKFDTAYSRLFSGRSPTSEQLTDKEAKAKKAASAVDAQKFIEAFKSNVRPPVLPGLS